MSVYKYETSRGIRWRYEVVVDNPHTGTRDRRTQSGFATKREATAAREELVSSVRTGSYADPSGRTLGQFLVDEWLPSRAPRKGDARRHRGRVGVQTFETYQVAVHKHIVPRLGARMLQQLTKADVDALYDALEEDLAAKTVKNIHGVLHKALSDATRLGYAVRNVADQVEPPTAQRPELNTWDVEQLRVFVRSVEHHPLRALWLLCATTGMRRGEMLGLDWDDLDLDAGKLRVTWTLGQVEGKAKWKSRAKSKAGERTMSLDPTTVEALRIHRRQQLEQRLLAGTRWDAAGRDGFGDARPGSGPVFRARNGRVLSPSWISRRFRMVADAAGLPRIRLHDVRHAYATAGLRNARGLHEMKQISQRLGHASVGTTLDIYAHVLPGEDAELTDTLARMVYGQA